MVAESCWAGGLYITEFGTPSTGVANAGAVAVGKDASTAWHNPASMMHLSGTQIMGAAGLLIPNIKFDPDSDTPVAGGDGGQAGILAPVMNGSFVHSLTDKFKFGFALGSLAGAGLDYGKTWAGRNMATKVQLLTVTGMPSLAFKTSLAVNWSRISGLLRPFRAYGIESAHPGTAHHQNRRG
jgi:long-chain fatty acid transport protein